MRFCLREVASAKISTPLWKLLAEYLDELMDGNGLTSKEFESALRDISTKYQNGDVHEHLVTFETCHEAVNRILQGPQPLLKRLVEATAGNDQKI